ncbi:TetR family transcriptional regulator [Corynebacterium kutscheri]|uniref:TetR family transcriptional regulator n=1 Tax=Corynebacterium kutscheri TaxID=35755 RepID=A0A0F6TEW9_9CORY|nr:TetR/AcrR family transcriptional regulator [Corynebacterium kutscheri]AKE42174.1 transcriptional regulator, TetR family [Corynebacterium kutscheri]VEH05828.1 TetR family transcriptional regulator [Corynebacterium kutscheri]VEH10517.1 TetR family transcriptional regulator [Corynebacterium kutscheri]VEH81721.1 TetR family transcriptional regulator [Corynebacterium kutscheri]
MAEAKAAGRRKNRPSPRQRLLDSATELFSTQGIRVIGIDRILREADVAKASLYSLFGSKDALVIAYLEELDRKWRDAYSKRTEEMLSPEEKILAFFDQYIEQELQRGFRGSLFLNAANEYPCPESTSEHGILEAVIRHRSWMVDEMTTLLELKNGYPGSTQAQQLMIYLDGGLAGGVINRDVSSLHTARALAVQLLSEPPADYSI